MADIDHALRCRRVRLYQGPDIAPSRSDPNRYYLHLRPSPWTACSYPFPTHCRSMTQTARRWCHHRFWLASSRSGGSGFYEKRLAPNPGISSSVEILFRGGLTLLASVTSQFSSEHLHAWRLRSAPARTSCGAWSTLAFASSERWQTSYLWLAWSFCSQAPLRQHTFLSCHGWTPRSFLLTATSTSPSLPACCLFCPRGSLYRVELLLGPS